MATALESNKTKIARRVIEVFEFFDHQGPTATVSDIVRQYKRPQSSTSELLASLVELGFLYKDPLARSYSPTPRLAGLGMGAQPRIIRDGRLFTFMDRLAGATRCGVALFGMVGTHAQIFHWSPGADALTRDLRSGDAETLCATTAGLLLLSTLPPDRAARLLWRLNAEAPAGQKFNHVQLGEQIAVYRRQRHANGAAGFVADARVTAMLLPSEEDGRPLALGLVYPQDCAIDPDAVLATIERGVAQCLGPENTSWAFDATAPLVRAV